jgi:hypothetical protein
MTETLLPPTAPGRTGLPGDEAPVTRQPPAGRRVRARVVLAGAVAALAVGGVGGALTTVLDQTLASPPVTSQVATSTSHHATPAIAHPRPAPADREEQD